MDNLVLLEGSDSFSEHIKKVEFFSDLESDEITLLAEWAKCYIADAGTTILKEGGDTTSLCVIVEGAVTIIKKVSPFESINLADIKAGGVIGEMGIIDGEPVSASVRATEDSIVIIITGEDFDQMVEKNGDLGVKLYRKISRIVTSRLRQTTAMLADLSMSKESRILRY